MDRDTGKCGRPASPLTLIGLKFRVSARACVLRHLGAPGAARQRVPVQRRKAGRRERERALRALVTAVEYDGLSVIAMTYYINSYQLSFLHRREYNES